jgi:hypothetical protein
MLDRLLERIIDTTNLNLLSQDTNAAVNIFQTYLKDKTPIGLLARQAIDVIPCKAKIHDRVYGFNEVALPRHH